MGRPITLIKINFLDPPPPLPLLQPPPQPTHTP